MHDLLLSRPEVRERVYAELARWMNAYSFPAEQPPTEPQLPSEPDPRVGTAGLRPPSTDDGLS
jgi:hypothetical protein